MNTGEFTYEVGIFVDFTDDELALLRRCCIVHYDVVVRSSAKQGGFLYGWLNMRRLGTAISCSFSQLDTCAKSLEQPPQVKETETEQVNRWNLRAAIMKVLGRLNKKTAALCEKRS